MSPSLESGEIGSADEMEDDERHSSDFDLEGGSGSPQSASAGTAGFRTKKAIALDFLRQQKSEFWSGAGGSSEGAGSSEGGAGGGHGAKKRWLRQAMSQSSSVDESISGGIRASSAEPVAPPLKKRLLNQPDTEQEEPDSTTQDDLHLGMIGSR